MPKYIVKEGPLEHDGKRYETGSPVELSEEQAAPLAGVVAPAAAEVKKGKDE